jgi:hypothetical protein
MNRILILGFIVFTFLSSCRRNSDNLTEVNGHVYDRETLDSLPGAQVFIIKRSQLNGLATQQGQTTASSEGKYSYSFEADNNYNYAVAASYGNYLIAEYYPVNSGWTNNNVDIFLARPGYLSLHIKNINPFDANDKISIFDSDYVYLEYLFSGINVDTTIILTARGNQLNSLNWRITRNDTTNTYNQTVNYISLDTVYLDLFY